MVNPLAALSVHLILQLIISRYCTALYLHNHTSELGTPLSNDAVVVPDGYTAFPDIGVAYKYFTQNLTWYSARKHCIAEGGNLAVIDSFEKMKHANELTAGGPAGPLLGIHRLFNDAEWVSVKTGLPLAYVPWRIGDRNTQKCTALWGSNQIGVGSYNCDYPTCYMCEIPIPQPSQIQFHSSNHNGSQYVHTPRTATKMPTGYTVFPDVGVAYKHYATRITWDAARKYCAAHGGNLAIIDSYEKIEYVLSLRTSNNNVHVGMHRLFDIEEWNNVKDGSIAVAIPWGQDSYQSEMARKCMALYTITHNPDIGLFASKCGTLYSFVCEVSLFQD